MLDPSPSTEPLPNEVPAASVLRRRRALWLLGGGAVGLTVGGLASARLVRSPAQRVTDTAPPPHTVLTAVVERRVLADTVVLRGQVGASTSVEVRPMPGEAGLAVVTAVRVELGDQFDSGTVLLEVSGRPIFVMAGEIPAYRDLLPGSSGRDVTQLQRALAELGYRVDNADGQFGAATKTAVASFYDELGYEAPTAGDPDALVAADDAVRQAERALVEAQDVLEQVRRDGPLPSGGESDPNREAERQVEFAQEDVRAARQARDEAERTTGPMLPLSEVVYLPEFPARVEQTTARVGLDITTAEQEGPLLAVSSGALVVRARLNPAQRELLSEGMSVEILSELSGITAVGEIASIGDATADPETGSRGHEMTVASTDRDLDEQLAGAEVRVTVQAASTEEEVLVVPISAVFADADAQVVVLRVNPDGSQERVAVAPGVSGDGYVAITPLGGTLTPGDQVVVGGAGGPL